MVPLKLRLQRQAIAVKSLYDSNQERSSIEQAWERIHLAFTGWRESLGE
jgi:hypothetical protein